MKTNRKIFAGFAGILAMICIFAFAVNSADIKDFTSGNNKLSKSAYDPGTNAKVPFIQVRYIDTNDSSYNKGDSGVTTGDTLRLVNIPPNTYIHTIWYKPMRLVGYNNGVTYSVGDGSDKQGWILGAANQTAGSHTSGYCINFFSGATGAGVSMWNVAGNSQYTTTGTAYNLKDTAGNYFTKDGGKIYTSADTIDMYIGGHAPFPDSRVTPAFLFGVEGFHLPTKVSD